MFRKLMCINFLVINAVNSVEYNIFPNLPITVEETNNNLCNQHSKQYLNNLENLTLWAYEMRDASAQSISSTLRGSSYSLGNKQQCLTANAPFPTQYCLSVIVANIPNTKIQRDPLSLEFHPYENVINKLYVYKDDTKFPKNTIKMGWCIPASCTPNDAENNLNMYFKNSNYALTKENVTFSAVVSAPLCQRSDDDRGLDMVDKAFCGLVATLLVLVFMGTYLDSRDSKSEKKGSNHQLLQSFSVKRNLKDLFTEDESEKPLKIFYGIKTVSVMMILTCHRFALFVASPQITVDPVEKIYRAVSFSPLLRADLFVDTFFFISGLLVTYFILIHLDKTKFKPGLILVNRYLRLTPAYALLIFYQATLLYHTGSGALWEPVIGQEKIDCRKNWWTGLLYISNLINSEHTCLVQSWYLACDFQFFIISLLLIYVLHKNRIKGIIGIAVCMLFTIVLTFYLTYINERPAILRFLPKFIAYPKMDYDYNFTYIKTYTRGLPYFMGIIGGYVYYKLKGSNYTMSKTQHYAILLISTSVIVLLLFSGVIFYDPYYNYSITLSAAYSSLHRLVWALGTFGFTYAVSYGPTDLLYDFLSWKGFILLSKLSYGAYLWQMGFQIRDIGSSVGPKNFVMFDILGLAILDAIYSFSLSFVQFLVVEQPFKKVIKILLYSKQLRKNMESRTGQLSQENHKTEDSKNK